MQGGVDTGFIEVKNYKQKQMTYKNTTKKIQKREREEYSNDP